MADTQEQEEIIHTLRWENYQVTIYANQIIDIQAPGGIHARFTDWGLRDFARLLNAIDEWLTHHELPASHDQEEQ